MSNIVTIAYILHIKKQHTYGCSNQYVNIGKGLGSEGFYTIGEALATIISVKERKIFGLSCVLRHFMRARECVSIQLYTLRK